MEEERSYYPLIGTGDEYSRSTGNDNSISSSTGVSSSGVTRSMRVAHPMHYTVRIDSFYIISNTLYSYGSLVFEAGGHKWRLNLYPNGHKKRDANAEGYISLYLEYAEERDDMPLGLEINVIFKFFLYDHIRDKYYTVQDSEGRVRCFHKTKPEQGFSQFIPLVTFNNPCNGYLVDDACEFGVEVFVLENRTKVERMMNVLNEPYDHWHFTWTIPNFSTLPKDCYFSQQFHGGGKTWKLEMHPRGYRTQRKNYLSLLIGLADYMSVDDHHVELNNNSKIMQNMGVVGRYLLRLLTRKNETATEARGRGGFFVQTMCRIVDQLHGEHIDRTDDVWLNPPTYYISGFMRFMLLSDLHDESKGYLVNDTLIIQVKFNAIYALKII